MSQETLSQPGLARQEKATKRSSLFAADARLGWLLVLPALIVVLGLVGYPFLKAIRISFTDRMIGRGPGNWVGLDNYAYILAWPQFTQMVVRTVAFTIAAVLIKTTVRLILAAALNQNFRGRDLCVASLCCPGFCPPTSSCSPGARSRRASRFAQPDSDELGFDQREYPSLPKPGRPSAR